MIHQINSSTASYAFMKASDFRTATATQSQIKEASLPVIATLGNQARMVGDGTNPASVARWTDIPTSAPVDPSLCITMGMFRLLLF